MTKLNDQPFSYEEAFQRLEKILTTLNEGSVPLDQSLHLFEEANGLIETCSKQLNTAEKRIESLIKGREGQLKVDSNGNPETENFQPAVQNSLNQHTGELT